MDLIIELVQKGFALRDMTNEDALKLQQKNPQTIEGVYRTKGNKVLIVSTDMQGRLRDELLGEHQAKKIIRGKVTSTTGTRQGTTTVHPDPGEFHSDK